MACPFVCQRAKDLLGSSVGECEADIRDFLNLQEKQQRPETFPITASILFFDELVS
jgi:SpoVK/Ycf46/Vps4 family AAA+-type ATPase